MITSPPNSSWSVRDFVLAGVIGALTFAVAFILGAGIISATGIPATGGIANIFAAVFVVTVGMKIVERRWFATLAITIVFGLAIPTIIGGPPGAHKIVNGLVIGLSYDITLIILGYSRIGYVIAGSSASVVSILSIYVALVVFGLPGAAQLRPLLLPLAGLQAITGALGAWAAVAVFDRRLSKIDAVKRLSNE